MFDFDGYGLARVISYAVLMLAAIISETQTRKIPNALTYTFILLGLGLSVAEGLGAPFPWTPLGYSVAGLILGVIGGLVMFTQRMAGGGAIKLIVAACTLGRSPFALYLLVTFLLIGIVARVVWKDRDPASLPGSITTSIASVLAVLAFAGMNAFTK